MFLAKLQWQMPLYSRQIVNGCFRLGPAPFFCVLCCFASLATKRKSGWGICGSSCCVVLFSCLVVGDRFALWYWPIELGTTFHCLCLFQDRATVHLRPNSRKKKFLLTSKSCTFTFWLFSIYFYLPRCSI